MMRTRVLGPWSTHKYPTLLVVLYAHVLYQIC
jgi:hypothetical protein